MSNTMTMGTRIKLSAMMFLQFIMFAVFWAALAPYVTNQGEAWASWKPWILSTMALGSLASPLMGMFADRYFNGEKVLAFSNMVCAAMLFMAARATSGLEVFVYLLIAMLFYMPTWGLTAAIAMASTPAEQFPQIRVFGTIGWVSSVLFGLVAMHVFGVKIDGTNIPFYCGAASAVVAALIALLCPATPPKGKGQPFSVVDALGLRALSLLKEKNFAIFLFVTLVAMIPFNIHFAFLGDFLSSKGFQQVTAVSYIGQAAEVFCMLLVTWAMRKFGVKWSIIAGLAALTIRYAAYYFAAGDMTSLVYIGILIHGIIFGFFIVGGQVYVGKTAPAEIQGQAQGLYALMAFGIGSFIGTFANNELINHFTDPVKRLVEGKEVTLLEGSWDKVWLVTLVCSVICLVVMTIFFNPKKEEQK
jgi:nucleoside transporter